MHTIVGVTTDRSADDRLGPQSCSVAARARRDPLPGSAPPAHGWLVFEFPGPWPRTATDLFGDLGPQMARRTLAAGVRPMLVRRPGRSNTDAARSWWFVDSLARTAVRGTWETDADVEQVLDLVDRNRAWAVEQAGPAEPMVLVCVHAKHDVCCAVRGRPIAADLAERWPELVWECSHLGGDRFAGNIAMLPDSTFYGGLDTAEVGQLVADHLDGEVTLESYRGSGLHPAPAQAAVAELLRRTGSRRHGDVSVAGVQTLAAGVWEVVLAGRGDLPAHTVFTVVRHWRTPEQLTCLGPELTKAAEFEVR